MKYEVLHPGPYLTIEDIRPHITKDVKTCIYSAVPGTQGIIKINCAGKMMSKNGTKMPAVVFDRGVEVMIVKDDQRPMIITRINFEKIKQAQAQSEI